MRNTFLLTLLSFSSLALSAPLIDLIQGNWQGQCQTNGSQQLTFQMSLSVKPTPANANRYDWIVRYYGAGLNQVRNYTLIIDPNDPDSFAIDENNGLILDGRFVGNKMIQLFSLDSGIILSATNEIRGNMMTVTMPSWSSRNPRVTKTTDGSNTARAYRLTGLQECRLSKS